MQRKLLVYKLLIASLNALRLYIHIMFYVEAELKCRSIRGSPQQIALFRLIGGYRLNKISSTKIQVQFMQTLRGKQTFLRGNVRR